MKTIFELQRFKCLHGEHDLYLKMKKKKKNLFVIIYREKNQFLFDLQNAVRILDVNLTLYVTKYD